jgi:hypothetical protein
LARSATGAPPEAQDLRGIELIGRRRMLQKALKKAGPVLRFSEHRSSVDGEALFRRPAR